jgi:hypothetical protein
VKTVKTFFAAVCLDWNCFHFAISIAMNATPDCKTFTVLGATSDTGRLVADSPAADGHWVCGGCPAGTARHWTMPPP